MHDGLQLINLRTVQQALASVAAATSLADLTARVDACIRAWGFGLFNLIDFARWRRGPDEEPWIVSTFPLEWVLRYHKANYGSIDPLPHILVHSAQIAVRSATPPPADPTHAATMAKVRAAEIQYGIEDFVAVPVQRLDISVGALFVSGPTAVCEGMQAVAVAHLAPAIYQRALALEDGRSVGGRDKARGNLSRREADCLKWAAAGKTTWEIGAILGISEHTVAVHLRHVNRKLNVSSRAQAVAEAMKRNLL